MIVVIAALVLVMILAFVFGGSQPRGGHLPPKVDPNRKVVPPPNPYTKRSR